MDLQEILKSIGMNVGDIRSRVSTGSIKLNGDEVEDVRKDIGEIFRNAYRCDHRKSKGS
jgi:hypothetical protein